jgi:hypothetical protein
MSGLAGGHYLTNICPAAVQISLLAVYNRRSNH